MADKGDTNGTTAVNVAEDEEEVQIPRPPAIEQDVKEMERRKRVKMIIESQIFKEELERIIETQLSEGYSPSTLAALQQVTELLLPSNTSGASGFYGSRITPINDIRGIDTYRYDKLEKQLRCKLAAVNRLIELNGWSSSSNSITIRISQDNEHFITIPYGLHSNEISASTLLKVDMQGNIVDFGSTNFTFNRQAFGLHSAIHLARPDIKAIIHLSNPPCVAISSLKKGLLCLSAEAAIVGELSYHVFKGVVDEEERSAIGKSLGTFNKVLILRNYGILACGASIEEAFFLAQNLVAACEIQLKFTSLDNVFEMSEDVIKQTRALLKGTFSNSRSADSENQENQVKVRKWKIYDLEFESKMRMLDNAGYRTGYIYKQALLRTPEKNKLKLDDIEIPPASQSHLDDNWIVPLRKLVDGKRTQDRLSWVNSPNNYQRVEFQETGTSDPKTITKWVSDGSPSKQPTSVKIDKSHQFVPINVQSNEFRKRQKELKFNRLQNKISAGPQSEILEGVTWEELSSGPDVQKERILIGAASKGIIQKEYQHNARVYKSAYEKNPFDNVTEQELEEYRSYVQRLQKGENVDDVSERVKQMLKDEDKLNELKSPQSEDEQIRSGSGVKLDLSKPTVIASIFKSLLEAHENDKFDTSVASTSVEASSRSEKKDKKEKKKKLKTPSFLKKKSKKEKA